MLDLASGSGLVAIAAARAGAAAVRAVEIDQLARRGRRAQRRGQRGRVDAELGDVLDGDAGGAEVVLAGDVFYSQAMADRVLRFLLRAARAGARVLVGDPGRAFLPHDRFDELAVYDVPVPETLESVRVKRTTVWQLRAGLPGAGR